MIVYERHGDLNKTNAFHVIVGTYVPLQNMYDDVDTMVA